jgi:hypothetical protein
VGMRKQILLIGLALAACGVARSQWQMQDSHTTADLRGIANVGNGVAWASGTNGTVLRTEDGGSIWQTCAIPPGAEHLDFRGVQAFDANTAIVMASGKGDLSRLYKTTDGCRSWRLVFTNPDKDGFWDAIRITGPRTALMIGDPLPQRELSKLKTKTYFHFPLYGTTNSGDAWIRLDTNNLFAQTDSQGKLTESIFAASNSTLLEIKQHEMIIYASGGSVPSFGHMELIDRPDPLLCKSRCWVTGRSGVPLKEGPTAGVFSFDVRNGDATDPILVAVGGDYSAPESVESTAATCARNDKLPPFLTGFKCELSQSLPRGYRSAVAYDDAMKAWITVGPNGTDVSTDDGRNWRAVRPDPALHEASDADRNWNALSLPFVASWTELTFRCREKLEWVVRSPGVHSLRG